MKSVGTPLEAYKEATSAQDSHYAMEFPFPMMPGSSIREGLKCSMWLIKAGGDHASDTLQDFVDPYATSFWEACRLQIRFQDLPDQRFLQRKQHLYPVSFRSLKIDPASSSQQP